MDRNKKGVLTFARIDEFLEQPYWIVDILPAQVPADSPGQYFAVQDYFLRPPQLAVLHRKFAEILLKLNCYFDLSVGSVVGDAWIQADAGNLQGTECGTEASDPGTEAAEILWTRNPDPEELAGTICGTREVWTLNVFAESEDALICINSDDTYMTVYHPTERLLDLLRKLAAAEGLFVWQPEAAE